MDLELRETNYDVVVRLEGKTVAILSKMNGERWTHEPSPTGGVFFKLNGKYVGSFWFREFDCQRDE